MSINPKYTKQKEIYKNIYFVIKRIFDILLSILLLIVCSPLFLLITVLIKLEDGGKVFFKQKRTGLGGKTFIFYKFRSYGEDHDPMNSKSTVGPTKVGEWLRKTSLDELPQFINILKNEMSLIGPRPWMEEYNAYYTQEQKRRFLVLPGLTGYAQCQGRKQLGMEDRIKYDVYYVDNISFLLDLEIFLKTIHTVLTKKGNTCRSSVVREIEELKQGLEKEKEKAKEKKGKK